jgi:hypothetical protein
MEARHDAARMRCAAWLVLLGVVPWLPAPARAEPSSISIAWDAPEGCPSEAQTRAAVARWLDAGGSADGGPRVEARAEVTRSESQYELDLTVKTSSGESRKRLTSPSCATLMEAVALQVSLLATPASARANRSAGRDDDGAAEPGGIVWGARMIGGAGTGPTPGWAPTVGLVGSLRYERVRLELGGSYGPGIERSYALYPEVGASFAFFAGQARGCYAWVKAPLELPACVGAQLGMVQARGFGVDEAFTTQRAWAALDLVQALRWPATGPVSAWGELGGAAALLRPGFRMRNLERLYRPGKLIIRATLGLELSFD